MLHAAMGAVSARSRCATGTVCVTGSPASRLFSTILSFSKWDPCRAPNRQAHHDGCMLHVLKRTERQEQTQGAEKNQQTESLDRF